MSALSEPSPECECGTEGFSEPPQNGLCPRHVVAWDIERLRAHVTWLRSVDFRSGFDEGADAAHEAAVRVARPSVVARPTGSGTFDDGY